MSLDREAGGAGATTAPDGTDDGTGNPAAAPGIEEAFFRRLVESSLDVSYSADAGGFLTYISPQVARYGWTPAQLAGRNMLELVADEDRDRVARELARPSAGGTAPAQIRIRGGDGTLYWFEEAGAAQRDAAGRVTGFIGVLRDITERNRMNQLLVERERQLSAILQTTPDGFWLVDQEGRIRDANAAACETSGYSRDEILALHVHDLEINESERATREHMERIRRNGSDRFESRHRCKDGRIIAVEVSVNHLDLNGGGFVSFIRDITERKRAEAALRESEEQFRAMFETASIGMAQAELATGQWLRVNRRLCEITGYTEDEMLRMRVAMVTHPEDRQRDWALFQRVVNGELPAYQLEKRYVRKDGTIAWVNVNMTVIRDTAGRPLRTVATIEDITGRRRIEAAAAESSRQFRFLYDNMLEACAHCRMICDGRRPVDFEFLAVNPSFERVTGLAHAAGRRISSLVPDFARDNAEALKLFGTVARTGRPARWEHRVAALDRWFSFSVYSPAKGEFIAIFDNITGRKRTEQRVSRLSRAEAILSGVNHSIARTRTRTRLLADICRVAVRRGGYRLAWIGLVRTGGDIVPEACAGPARCLAALRRPAGASAGPAVMAVRENRPVIAAQPAPGADAVAAFPLRIDGRVAGAFCVQARQAGVFDDEEVRLLLQVGDDISFALAALEHEEERHKAEERLRLEDAALAAAANGVAIIDRDGNIVWVNKAFTTMTGYALDEVRGRNPRVLKSGLHDEDFYRNMWATILAGRVWGGQLINRRKDGSHYNEEMTITPVRSGRGRITHFIAIKQDITQRKRLESEMNAAVEREQERIGNDLHDGLCQILTGAKFRTALLGQKLRGWAPVAETGEAEAIEDLLDQAIEQARGISYGLNPVRDAPDGLVEALEQLAAGAHNGISPRCVCRIPEPVPVHDRSVAVQLFRIAQEAVQNALRHARARVITIELTRRDEDVQLMIADDGAGLPQPDRLRRGKGLMNMQRRAGLIGATLELRRLPRRGTQVICHLRRPEFAKENQT